MKKIYIAFALIAASFCFSPMKAFADDEPKDTGVALNKSVTGPDKDGQYLITLEAYATGASVKTITEEVQPNDIIIILDDSYSMGHTNVDVNTKTNVASGTKLSAGTNYIVTLDGKDYYLKGFDYKAEASQGYSYNSVNDGEYYYFYNDNYYPVSGYQYRSNRYYLTFKVRNTTYYLRSNGNPSSNRSSGAYASSATDNIWTGVLYTKPGTPTFAYNGDDVPENSADGQPFHPEEPNYTVKDTDQIYTYRSESKSRLKLAQDAAVQFVETVYSNSPAAPKDGEKQEYHKIAIVTFNNKASILVSPTDVKSDTYIGIQDKIKTTKGDTMGTYADDGLDLAGTILEDLDDGRKKIVVFFTDGVPGNSNTELDAGTARAAVHSAYALKNTYGATVFSVAVLSSSDMSKMNMRRYLHYVSSNYKFDIDGETYAFTSDNSAATCQIEGHSEWHGSEEPHDYYQLSDGSDLTSIFNKIAEEASSGGSSITLDSETTTVLDVLTADFILPEGTDISKIGLYLTDVTGYNADTKKYSFGDRYNLVPSGAQRSDYVSIADAETSEGKATKKIVVTGFDFTKQDVPSNGDVLYGNWVGPRETTIDGVTTTVYKGKRLVITIPIETAPDYQGGYNLPTNTLESGIYSGETCIDTFPVPELDFPSIGIIKNGMAVGESATFTVQRIKDASDKAVSDAAFTIFLSGKGASTPAYAVIKNIPEGTYKVTESNWSWTYDVTTVTIKDGEAVTDLNPSAPATTQVLAKNQTTAWPSGIKETVKCVLFNFTNKKNEAYDSADEHSIYSEAVVKNTFTGGSVVKVESKTTQSKTTQSKE